MFRKNRDRVIEHDEILELFCSMLNMTYQRRLLSAASLHWDCDLIHAGARDKRMRREDGSDPWLLLAN